MTVDQIHLDTLKNIAGEKGYSEEESVIAAHITEPRGKFTGKSKIVLFPDTKEKVAEILKYCSLNDIKAVPQGGITGLVGGGIPDNSGNEIIISLKKMNRVRQKDTHNQTMTLESGVILADAHDIADSMNAELPMHIASEGSAMIGGNISTNAGGINVLRYGNMRDFVLGLEVVLPNGDIWDGLSGLRKDNTGYDLKQIFIGAEGTLGIITAATLKVYPKNHQRNTAFVALKSPKAAIELLSLARRISGDSLIAFEIIPRLGLEFTTKHMPDCKDPLENSYDWYVIMECATSMDTVLLNLEKVMETILENAFDNELILDGVVPKNIGEARSLWNLREFMSEAQKHEGGSIKHDVSVPISKIPEFLELATKAVMDAVPGIRPVPFGHIGDGNIHFNLSQPVDMDRREYLLKWEDINRLVHTIVTNLGGSISAEHGIGILKTEELEHFKSEIEINLMRKIKSAIDPTNTLNPGRILRLK